MSAGQWVWAAAAFAAELAMLAVAGIASYRLARPAGLAWAIVAAVGAVAVFVAIWSLWMAPTAAYRLPLRPRVVAACAIVLATAALLAASGPIRTAVVYAVLGCAVMVIAQPVINSGE